MKTLRGDLTGIIVGIGLSCLLGISCKSYREQEADKTDTRFRGTIRISADESFKPVIDEQVQVYESNNPGTRILVDYKPEADCLKDMLTDSVRMIIATRVNTESEKNARFPENRTGKSCFGQGCDRSHYASPKHGLIFHDERDTGCVKREL